MKLRIKKLDIISEYEFNYYGWMMEEKYPGELGKWWVRWQAVRETITDRLNRACCWLFDHDYQTDGADYPDSGGEGFTCERCGHSFTAWH